MQLWTIPPTQPEALVLDNTADAETVDWQDHPCIELMFPKFTDGRAYSQAHVLRRRGYAGDIRAVGDVLRAQFDSLGFTTRWVDQSTVKRAGHLVAEHPGPGPKILLIGHLDTV